MQIENFKDNRAQEIISRKASEFIQRESNGQSLVTVTNISTSKDFKNATIFVTVFPDHKNQAVMDFLKRQRSNFRNFVKSTTRLNKIPLFDFEIDFGEKSRQKVDELL
jgi:ribosome-binding factor A